MVPELQSALVCAHWYSTFEVFGTERYEISFANHDDVGHCTCPAWEYSPAPKTCKHVAQVFRDGCFWHPLTGEHGKIIVGPVRTFAPAPHSRPCPKCGGPTSVIRVAA